MDTPINTLDRDKFIVGIWADIYGLHNLPAFLYHKTGKHLEHAVTEGFHSYKNMYAVNAPRKKVKPVYAAPLEHMTYKKADIEALKAMKENTWVFSAAKTYTQTHTLVETKVKLKKVSQLFDKNGDEILPYKAFKEGYYTKDGNYIDGALSIFETFNDTYFKSEYNTVITMSESCSHWNRIQDDVDLFPILEYSAVEDGVICEICAALDGVSRRVDDPWWDDNYPPEHYNNCRCTVIQLNESDGTRKLTSEEDAKKASNEADAKKRNPMFKNNVGKTHIIFKTDGEGQHPYFAIEPNLIDKNFNLPRYGR